MQIKTLHYYKKTTNIMQHANQNIKHYTANQNIIKKLPI